MSRSAWLGCRKCKQVLALGKPLREEDQIVAFGVADMFSWEREERNLALWKFLADHFGHELFTAFGDDLEKTTGPDFRGIGGDTTTEGDLSFSDYTANWLARMRERSAHG